MGGGDLLSMGIVMRQYNNFYIKFQRQFKKAHGQVIETMPLEFSNKEYIERFKWFCCKVLNKE